MNISHGVILISILVASACEQPKTKRSFEFRSTPIVFGEGVVQVETGTDFTCARSLAGSVACWGENLVKPGVSTTPKTIQTLPELTTISAGTYHVCGVSKSSDVICWGDSDGGPRPPFGVQVPDAIDVKVGSGFACSLSKDGSTWCWGKNTDGQIPGASASSVKTPSKIDCDSGTALVVGPKNAAVLTKNGWCAWGDANPEMLRRTDKMTGPVHLSANPSLAMNTGTACHVDGGKVACWGTVVKQREPGQDVQAKESDDLTVTAIAVDGINEAVVVSISDQFGCAQTATSLLCWGENAFGNLGDGTRTSRGIAKPVSDLKNLVQFETGANHVCAIDDTSALKCWGGNDRGQVGNGSRVGVNKPTDITIATSL